LLAPVFKLDHIVDAFVHQRSDNGHGRDLTGYEDGTENPEDDEAVAAGIAAEQGQAWTAAATGPCNSGNMTTRPLAA
jgi:deferrochelatase/peroxidase EfeB